MSENRNLIQPKKNPFLLFEESFEEAKLKEQNDPNAMNLSTKSKDLKPSSSIVLLKSFDQDGFVFYTNLQSYKGISLLSNYLYSIRSFRRIDICFQNSIKLGSTRKPVQ